MDPRALETLKAKIVGFVKNCEVVGSIVAGDDDWSRIVDIARLVAKLNQKWIREKQAEVMILNIVLASLPQVGTDVSGKLSDFVDVSTLIDSIFEQCSGLPREYNLYYELPHFTLHFDNKVDVSGEVGLEFLKDTFVQGDTLSSQLGLSLGSAETCYLRTSIKGYCDYDSSGETVQQSLTLLKAFVERGKSAGVLVNNGLVRLTSKKEAKPVIYIHELKNNVVVKIIRCSMARDVASVLTSLQLASSVRDGDNGLQIFVEGMRDFQRLTGSSSLLLSRVIAACEWSFDADSEHVPAMKVVKACIGLESVYGEDNSEGGLTKSLSDRCGYSLASDMTERKEIMRRCKELYKLRSSIVHGVKRKLSTVDSDLLMFGMGVLTRSIDKEISLLPG